MRRHRLAVTSALLLVMTALSSCATFELPLGPNGNAKLVAKILVDLPPELRPAAQLAIDEVNRLHPSEFEQTTLVAVFTDDTYLGQVDGATAKSHLRSYLDDNTVLGMVGPYNLQVARAVLPVANDADLPVISPALTDECLTQIEVYCTRSEPNSLRPHNAQTGKPGDLTFFRVPPVELTQADAAADYASQTLAKSSAYVVADDTDAAKRLSDEFTARWQLRGGSVVGTANIDLAAAPDPASLAAPILQAKPDIVFMDTANTAAVTGLAPLLNGTSSTIIVPDQLRTAALAAAAQSWHGVQLLCSSLSGDPSLRSATFQHEWAALHRGDPPPYALETYLATEVLIQAIRAGAAALVAQQVTALPTSKELLPAVQSSTVPTDDLVGVAFDSKGDDQSQEVTMFAAAKGRWSALDEVQGA